MYASVPRAAVALAAAAALTVLAGCNRTADDVLAGGWTAPVPNWPTETVYCYRTIGDDDCYAEPQQGQEARLIHAHPTEAVLERRSRTLPAATAPSGAP